MDLPPRIPIFPLTGTILLPGQKLPLNIFEPRYLSMVRYALERDKLIGMVQPQPPYDEAQQGTGPVYAIGGAGRIAAHWETEDGRIELVLEATSRFTLQTDAQTEQGFRLAEVTWDAFPEDRMADRTSDARALEPTEVAFKLKRFLDAMSVKINWEEAETLTGGELVDMLAMVLPFPPEDKQALLEAHTPEARFELLATLADMYSNPNLTDDSIVH